MYPYPSSRFGSDHPTIIDLQLAQYGPREAARARKVGPSKVPGASNVASPGVGLLSSLREFVGRLRTPSAAMQ